MTTTKPCIFCSLPAASIIDQNELAMAVRDIAPVNPGHTLIMPKRHVSSYFELTDEEALALMDLMRRTKKTLDTNSSQTTTTLASTTGRLADKPCHTSIFMSCHAIAVTSMMFVVAFATSFQSGRFIDAQATNRQCTAQ